MDAALSLQPRCAPSATSLWNTHDVIRRDALSRIQQTDFASGPQGSQLISRERFARDSAGRVHNESYRYAFAQANALDVASNYLGNNAMKRILAACVLMTACSTNAAKGYLESERLFAWIAVPAVQEQGADQIIDRSGRPAVVSLVEGGIKPECRGTSIWSKASGEFSGRSPRPIESRCATH